MPDTIQTTEEFRDEIRGLFHTMSDNIGTMARDMGSLRIAVVGDPMTGTTGLLLRMTEVEKDNRNLEKRFEKEIQELKDVTRDEKSRIDKKIEWIKGVGALAGIVFSVILALIESGHFFGH